MVASVAATMALATAVYGAPRSADATPGDQTPDTPPAATATGRIEGTVEISTALTARRPQIRIYADPGSGAVPPATAARCRGRRGPQRRPLPRRRLRHRLPASADLIARRRHGSIAQHDERFVPHVLAVMQGATVDFPNQDDIYHNVYSLSAAAGRGGFDLGRYPKGSSRSWTFPKPGTVQVFCHIHGDMSALVLVLANPFFATPDENHRYAIDDVPEGDYTIVGWHERLRLPISRHVHVTAGQTATVNFNIPLPQGGAP